MSSLLSKLINLAGNITGTLGIANGGTGQVTANAAMGALSPMTTRGDLIRQGAAAPERFAAVTTNRVVRGNGTDVVLGQIDATGFFTTGAEVAQAAPGVVKSAGQLLGTNTNDSAAAGYVGEIIQSNVSSATNMAATGNWSAITTISLTAGDWLVTGLMEYALNGAVITDGMITAVSINSGNTTTDQVAGSNQLYCNAPTSISDSSACVANYHLSLSATTTVYLKGFASFTGGPPKFLGRLTGVRIR